MVGGLGFRVAGLEVWGFGGLGFWGLRGLWEFCFFSFLVLRAWRFWGLGFWGF